VTGVICAIHGRFPGLAATLPRIALGAGPTPVRRLGGLEAKLGAGAPLWVKHDGLYGSLYGGNKARKLEWILADVKARGRRSVMTIGGTGTNHGLATAIYGRAQGLQTVLLLVDQPETERVELQLERMARAGAVIHRTHGSVRTAAAVPWLLLRHGRPYFLWVGGSSPIGTVGYVEAALELGAQVARGELPEPAEIVVALGSGGTVAGLVVGLRLAGLRSRVRAIVVSKEYPIGVGTVRRLATRTAALLRARGASDVPAEVRVDGDALALEHGFVGGGYGHATEEAEAAVRLVGETEGLTLEGVYTGKTMAGLIALRKSGALGMGPVLYWHTYNALPLPPDVEVARLAKERVA
jgi:D-cysteine desulfhydrase